MGCTTESRISQIAVDPLADYLAVVDQSGKIFFDDISLLKEDSIDGKSLYFSPIEYKLSPNIKGGSINTIDLKFDETHSWLGWLNDQGLTIWNMKNYLFPIHFRMSLEKGNVISFDRAGKIIAVATQNGITFFDIGNETKLYELAVGEVTALYFSHDNRTLFWGDTKGKIHLWGVTDR